MRFTNVPLIANPHDNSRVGTLLHRITTGKSLKFMERPNLEHLQKQHHLIASSIRQIALHEKSYGSVRIEINKIEMIMICDA